MTGGTPIFGNLHVFFKNCHHLISWSASSVDHASFRAPNRSRDQRATWPRLRAFFDHGQRKCQRKLCAVLETYVNYFYTTNNSYQVLSNTIYRQLSMVYPRVI